MITRGRPRHYTVQDERLIALEYQSGALSMAALADKHGCSTNTVSRIWAKHAEWARLQPIPESGLPPIVVKKRGRVSFGPNPAQFAARRGRPTLLDAATESSIAEEYKTMTQAELAAKHGCSQKTIANIIRRQACRRYSPAPASTGT